MATAASELNLHEATRYARRVAERWPLERAMLGGARVDGAQGAGAQRERGEEFVVVLVSDGFDGVPWLERVYVAESLWDALEMGAPVEAHCYTPAELERRVEAVPRVAHAVRDGVDLLGHTAG